MSTLTIISPHQDDAALSLACCLATWAQMPDVHVRIVNCFTVSSYCPFSPCDTVAEVSALRSAEDAQFNNVACGGNLHITNLGLVDSLLRLSETNIDRVLDDRDLNDRDMRTVARVSDTLATYVDIGIIFVPLGVGHHIDHRIVARACTLLQIPQDRLLFYLDVPYWLRMKPADVRRRVTLIQAMVGYPMVPFALCAHSVFNKSSLIHIYSSQLRETDVSIAVQAPFNGEVLLGIRGTYAHRNLALQEISWMDLNL